MTTTAPKMYAKVIVEFDSAHRLAFGYVGECSHIHGHTYRVEVEVSPIGIFQQEGRGGMIMDFKILKSIVKDTVDHFFDHKYINDIPAWRIKCINPTAENMALFLWEELASKSLLTSWGEEVAIASLVLWEKIGGSCVTLRRD